MLFLLISRWISIGDQFGCQHLIDLVILYIAIWFGSSLHLKWMCYEAKQFLKLTNFPDKLCVIMRFWWCFPSKDWIRNFKRRDQNSVSTSLSASNRVLEKMIGFSVNCISLNIDRRSVWMPAFDRSRDSTYSHMVW